jgi:hypothetical protein
VTTPYDGAPALIPVTVVTQGAVAAARGTAVLRLTPPLHDHTAGAECPACAARGDVRALLFDLLQAARAPGGTPLREVIVDASALADPQAVVERLERGRVPAFGLRDHTVARSFHLAKVV